MVLSLIAQTMNTSEETFFTDLGKRLADARKQAGFTQKQLCEHLGVAQQTLAHYENGKLRMPISLLPAFAKLTDVRVEELLGISTPSKGKRGPSPKIQQQMDAISQLPRSKQQFVQQFLQTVIDSQDKQDVA